MKRGQKKTFAERLADLGYADYRSYLESPRWRIFRKKVLKRDQRCQVCGGEAKEIHHKTYKRLGAESLDDVVAVCHDCHEKVHEAHKAGKIPLSEFVRVARLLNPLVVIIAALPKKSQKKKKKKRKERGWERQERERAEKELKEFKRTRGRGLNL